MGLLKVNVALVVEPRIQYLFFLPKNIETIHFKKELYNALLHENLKNVEELRMESHFSHISIPRGFTEEFS